MRNFKFLDNLNEYSELNNFCNKAERLAISYPNISVAYSRKALEYMVKTIYSINYKDYPEKLSLYALMTDKRFVSIIENETVLASLHFIRNVGNSSIRGIKVKSSEAILALESLQYFIGEIFKKLEIIESYKQFDKNLLVKANNNVEKVEDIAGIDILVDKNNIKGKKIDKGSKIFDGINISEKETRKLYIDLDLKEAGWEVLEKDGVVIAGNACVEILVNNIPKSKQNPNGKGYCDYVLFGDDGLPLAVVEAKRTSESEEKGAEQARQYADSLEKQYGIRPIIYYTNGYITKIIDAENNVPRKVFGYHTKEELKYLHSKRNLSAITNINIDTSIAGRPYQIEAITSVIEAFNAKRRRALVVLATGTGKTRTAVALSKVLVENNWVKNILFLADRTALAKQAKDKSFSKFFVDMPMSVFSDEVKSKRDYNARIVFSTYQTMINLIDNDKREFGIGRFDLIIIDEAHRSIFNKYRAIFTYFDSLIVGLTATPRSEILNNRSSFALFELPEGEPTNNEYTLEVASEEGYLVNYHIIDRTTKLLKRGLKYKDLSADEKEQYEETFTTESGELIEEVDGKEFYNRITNIDTIRLVLQTLMNDGLKINGGDKIGKTIIFAKDHKHALLIKETFEELYPQFKDGFIKVIDHEEKKSQTLIEDFDVRDKNPQIAVSVDMLDTGVDVNDIVNLVFFKRIFSKIKFVQMIGRGTRKSESIDVLSPSKDFFLKKSEDGTISLHQDKQGFYIIDFCDNFEYFGENEDGRVAKKQISLSQKLFEMKLDIVYALQAGNYQEHIEYKDYYIKLRLELISIIRSLNKHLINVKEKLAYVDKYSIDENWDYLSLLNIKEMKAHITQLVESLEDDEAAKSFDLRMFYIELETIDSTINSNKAKEQVYKMADKLLNGKVASLPQVKIKAATLRLVLSEHFWDSPSLGELEKIRVELRDIIKLLKEQSITYQTDFKDEVLAKEKESMPIANFKNYKQKVVDFLVEKCGEIDVLKKINNLEKIDRDDVKQLEYMLWQQLGTKQDYDKITQKTLGVFVRSIIGIDRQAINKKFGEYLTSNQFNSKQQEFIRVIIDYVIKNGDITTKDLIEDPLVNFNWYDLFNGDVDIIKKIINNINDVVYVAA